MGWLSGEWNKRIKLTIDQTKIDTANQLNFPVLVYISAASGIGDVDVSCVFDELANDANRKKIAITTSDGVTECYVEIERWDDANEKAWLWVKVPSVTYNADTDIYLYYDADHVDNTTYVGDTTDAVTHNVWDVNFKCVLHMAQDPNGDAVDAIKDSTSNANNGTPGGGMTSADLVDGKVGKALDLDGDDYVSIAADSSLKFGTGDFTIECIFKTSLSTAQTLLGYGDRHDNPGWTAFVGANGVAKFIIDDATTQIILEDAVDHADGSFHSYVAALDRDGNGIIYIDEVSVDTGDISGANLTLDTTDHDNIEIARSWHGSTSSYVYYFTGIGDEIRISNIIRSPAWVKATHYSNFDNLITFGSEEIVTTANQFDGKVCISPTIDEFDGKVAVKDTTTDQFDGKSVVSLVSKDEFDGKVQIKDVTTPLFDGKVAVKNIATNLFDGKAWFYPARDFFDGKIWIKEFIEGSVDLPFLNITGNTGAIGDLTLPFFEVLSEANVGIDAQGNITLPGLEVAGFTGAKCSYNLPSLGVSGTSVVGIAASGDVVLPIFGIDGQAFTDALVHGVFTLPALTVVASSIAGALCIGEVTLPAFGVSATAKIGTICTGAVTLPCLVIEGEGGHIPIGNGDVTLPLLQVYSTASILADPRDGCHVLRYNRWR